MLVSCGARNQNQLFKVDDSRNKNITNTIRNIEVSTIKIVKGIEKVLTVEGDQDGDGR